MTAGPYLCPADVQLSSDAQIRVRGHLQYPSAQILYPVSLPGGLGERGGRQQPPRLIGLAGAEFGAALEGTRGRGGATALLRLGGGFLKQGGHALVGFQRGCR